MANGNSSPDDGLPFPDLTGLRSRAFDRHTSGNIVKAEQRLPVSHAKVSKGGAKEVERDADWQEVVIAAWTIVLVHLLSAEDASTSRTRVQRDNKAFVVESITNKASRQTMDVSAYIQGLRQHTRIVEDERDLLLSSIDNAIVFGEEQVQGKPVIVLRVQRVSSDDEITLCLSASVQCHSQASVALHLQQVITCIQSICRAESSSTSVPAFALDRFDPDQLAGDGTPAEIIDDFASQSVADERFELQFEKRVKEFPDRIALDFRADIQAPAGETSRGNVQLTYKQVDEMTSSIAYHIRLAMTAEKSQTGHKVVALCLEKSHWTYIAIMAVLKSGAAWCPIDTDWPAARREALLAKSRANVVLTSGEQVTSSLEAILPRDMKMIRLDHISNHHASARLSPSERGSSSDELAYLIWTSGTTGLPKAVGIQHKAAVQALRALQRVIPYDKDDTSKIRYLQFSAYNFDLMILDMFYAWGLGGTLCSCTRTILLTNLVDASNAFRATHTLLTPAVMAMTPREQIPTLQVVINGGEKLSQIVADMWSVRCCLLNLYGPAEATLIAMNRRVPMGDTIKAPNIGRALPTTSCHALDANDNIVIKGAVGQLVLGGLQCAIGYVGDPDKTAEKFVHHRSLGRIYKTGDMVRQLWNGDFEYLGRVDDQVKINGIRIELLEINATIRAALEEVRDSETLVIPVQGQSEDDEEGVQIVNFSVVPRDSRQPGGLVRTEESALHIASSLIRHTRSSLPTYMVPSLFLIVDYFPKTSSAKIDRETLKAELKRIDVLAWQNRLASFDAQQCKGDAVVATELTQEGQTIRRCIANVCQIEDAQVGEHTPLPQLGLDSIKAITLSRRLHAMGIPLSVVDIVNHNTLSDLLQKAQQSSSGDLQGRQRKAEHALNQFDEYLRPALSIFFDSDNVERVAPCTPLQEALIAETMQDGDRYWLHRVFSLPAHVHVTVDEVTAALNKVVERVEVLRSCFLSRAENGLPAQANFKGNFVQVILKRYDIALSQIEPSENDEKSVFEARQVHALEVVGKAPPLAFTYVSSSTRPRLIMHIHHALYDQISLDMLASEIAEALLPQRQDQPIPTSFTNALPHILTLDQKGRHDQKEAWVKLLNKFDSQQVITPPSLSMRGQLELSPTSTIETFRRETSLAYDEMTKAAQKLSSSVRPMMQAALGVVLSHLCGTTQIMLGDAISGRALSSALDDVIGPVLATMPVPVSISAETTTFQHMCTTLSTFHAQALSYAYIPLTEVRQILQLSRHSELFHALFVFEPPAEQRKADRPSLRCVGDYGIAVEHPLAFEVQVTHYGQLLLSINVRRGTADAEMADVVLAQYEATISRMLSNANDLVIRTDERHLQTLYSVSKLRVPDVVQHALQHPAFVAFDKRAMAKPFQIAVEFYTELEGDRNEACIQLTYGQLYERSNQLAERLLAGLPRKSVVAVTLTRSLDTYVTLLSILRAGCTYLPIDVSIPLDRKKVMLKNSNAACLICHSSTVWLDDDQMNVQVLMLDRPWTPGQPSGLSFPLPSKDDPAYILFTSGSTGTPKGCLLTHGNLSAALASFRLAFDQFAPGSLKNGVRFLARSVESFDVALLEALFPLQIGGTVVTAPRHVILSNLGKAINALSITHAAVVPSLFYFDDGRRVKPDDVPSVRALIVGGERVQRDIIHAWGSSNVPLLNAYGPTEACIGTSIARLIRDDSTGNIGRPFASTQYMVVKEGSAGRFRPTMRGEAGELCIGGLQVGSYLGEDVRTDSFNEFNGTRLYRTGDEVRMWPDDTIEYLGRIGSDSQVKVRGVRVELGEIDATFTRDRRDVKVVTRLVSHPAFSSPSLVTFAAPRSSSSVKAVSILPAKAMVDSIMSVARTRLPSFMMPSVVVPLNILPLASISGKIDVKRVLDWFSTLTKSEVASLRSRNEANGENARPLTQAEALVRKEIVRLFDVREEDVGPVSDLFSLGLDSLNLIVLGGVLAKTHGLHMDIGKVMAHATLETIGQSNGEIVSDGHRMNAEWQELTERSQKAFSSKISHALPCLPLQASMVSQSKLDLENALVAEKGRNGALRYVNVMRMAVKQATDRDRLQEAIEVVLQRHDIYRTVFVHLPDSSALVQVVLQDKIDYSLFSKISSESTWGRLAARSIVAQIDRRPPLRYRIRSAAEDEHQSADSIVVDLAIHHALYDGISLDALFDEIAKTYADDRQDDLLSAQRTSFSDAVMSSTKVPEEDRLSYWTGRLRALTLNPLPSLTGREWRGNSASSVRLLERRVFKSLRLLKEDAQRANMTLAMSTLYAFAQLYGRYVGDEDVVVGLVLNGRMPSTAHVHGPCVNTVPFGICLREGIDRFKVVYADAIRYQHVPLAQLSHLLSVKAEKLFNTLFSFIGAQQGQTGIFTELDAQLSTGYPLAVEIETDESEDFLLVRFVYDAEHIPDRQMEHFFDQFDAFLSNTTKDVADSLLSIENLHASSHDVEHFIERFANQVAERPDEIAFVFAESLETSLVETTYAALDALSNSVARELRFRASSGSIIGVHMTQCQSVYPLLLGIWKADMTYLPLDPKLPIDRLEYICSIAQPSCIVTNSDDDDDGIQQLKDKLAAPLVAFSHLCKSDRTALQLPLTLDRAAYIMFTSGSSGKPKGVQISHRAVGAALFSWKQNLPFRPGQSRMLQLASPGFDVFLIEVCLPLAFGFSFASAPKEILLDDLEHTFHRFHITIADLPAALAVTVDPRNVPRLEWLMSGGDQLDQRVVDAWSDVGLVNAWGPTEATIGNTLGFVAAKDVSRSWIGYAYATSTILILHEESDEVALRGCIGELAVGGPQLADGYVGNEELTREKFITITLADISMRVYRTGDRGRILSDGAVECLGRIQGDGQVKINSQRVELKEIELALCQTQSVKSACVLYLEHSGLTSKQLVAFLILHRDLDQNGYASSHGLSIDDSVWADEVTSASLSQIATHLPAYMVPQRCIVLSASALPLTPNDKVDIRALKAFFAATPANKLSKGNRSDGEKTTLPWTPLEYLLRDIIANFAKIDADTINKQASLYTFGIDSISGFQLARRCRDRGLHGITAHAILSSPSITLLAQSIESASHPQSPGMIQMHESVDLNISNEERHAWRLSESDSLDAVLPCTPLQQGILLESLASAGRLYVHHHLFRFTQGAAYLQSVMKAFEALLQRHEMLRTSFHFSSEHANMVQVVHAQAYTDVSVEETETVKKTVDKLVNQQSWFATEEALVKPPIALRIVTDGSSTVLVDVIIHHALYDGESLDMLFVELQRLIQDHASCAERSSIPFRSLLPELLSTEKACQFWVNRLARYKDTIVASSANAKAKNSSCHVLERNLKGLNVQQVTHFASSLGVSLQAVALFTFAKLLSSLTQQRGVTFAQLFSLRQAARVEGAEGVIGPCLNTCLTSIGITGEEDVAQALQKIQSENDEGRRYRNASLATVQSKLLHKRDGKPFAFDAMFDMQRVQDKDSIDNNEGKTLVALDDDGGERRSTQYTLNVEFVQHYNGRISLVATAHADEFSQQRLRDTLERFEEILKHIVEGRPDQSSTDMPSSMTSLLSLPSAYLPSGHTAQNGDARSPTRAREGEGATGDTVLSELHYAVMRQVADLAQIPVSHAKLDRSTPLSSLGLDSIALMSLASRMRKAGLNVGVVDIVQGRTIDGIAEKVRVKQQQNQKQAYGNVHVDDQGKRNTYAKAAMATNVSVEKVEAVMDLLPGQLFELSQTIQSQGLSGFNTFLYQFTQLNKAAKQRMDVERMQEAWYTLRQRHAILRTSFVPLDGQIKQVVRTKESLTSASQDSFGVSTLPQRKFDDIFHQGGAESLAWIEKQVIVDRALRQPPAKCHVFEREESGDTVVILRLHHALYDAWSLPILLDDLCALYAAQGTTDKDGNDDKTIEFSHFVEQERRASKEQAQKYWTTLMRSAQPSIVRGSLNGDQRESFVFLRNRLVNVDSLEARVHHRPGGLSALLMAAWAKVLAGCVQRKDVVFGAYRLGRSSSFESVERIATNCMNILPLVVRRTEDPLSTIAEGIQGQLDEQRAWEDVSSIIDILHWTGETEPRWNTYINLLWPRDRHRAGPALLEPMIHFMTKETEQQEKGTPTARTQTAADASATMPDVRADVNVDVQLDPTTNSIHFGVRWKSAIWQKTQVEKLVESVCTMVLEEIEGA